MGHNVDHLEAPGWDQKLVTKADIEKLKSKTNISKLQLAERQLQGALDVVEKCQDQQHATKCLGRMMIRTILFILQKQKWGKETSKTWKTQDEILEAFTQEMANPKVESLQAAEPLVPRDLAKASSQDMALFQNPHIKLNKLHLALQNCFYSHTFFLYWLPPYSNDLHPSTFPRYNQQKDYPGKVFELTALDDSKATMVHKPVLAPPITLQIPFEELSKWKVSKAKMPEMYPAHRTQDMLPQALPFCKEEVARMEATLALHEACQKHAVSPQQVAFALHPASLFTLEAIKKPKGLKLIPMGNLSKAKDELPKGAITMERGGVTWHIHPWKQFHDWERQPQPQESLVPFWWCKPAENDYNMEFSTTTLHTTGSNFKICLTNMDKVGPNETLNYQKIDPAADDQGDAENQPSHAPKKRRKA